MILGPIITAGNMMIAPKELKTANGQTSVLSNFHSVKNAHSSGLREPSKETVYLTVVNPLPSESVIIRRDTPAGTLLIRTLGTEGKIIKILTFVIILIYICME